jgi:acetoin utilization deacetylase AcuC-like enzyme
MRPVAPLPIHLIFQVLTVRCFYHPGYLLPLPAEHPFPMDKFWRAEEMIRAAAPPGVEILPVEPCPEDSLRRVHSTAYLEKIRTGTLDAVEGVKLGLPCGEALLTRSRLEVAGMVAAMHAALADGLACNLAGGTHHAFADRGEGYCVLNDVAIAIRHLHCIQPDMRIVIIDTDAHQGNANHALFAEDERVFTYSIHVGKNYPSVKVPGSRDVPLSRYVTGADYLEQLESTLAPAVDEFNPALAFWISGADPHEHDRFGQMRLTDADFARRDHHVLDLVKARRIPTVLLYGGGYNRDRAHTARLHADTVLRAASTAHSWHKP